MILREDCLHLPYLSSIIISIHILRFSRSLIGEDSMQIKDVGLAAQKINDNISRLLIGKRNEIDLVLTCLFAGGHALLDDVP